MRLGDLQYKRKKTMLPSGGTKDVLPDKQGTQQPQTTTQPTTPPPQTDFSIGAGHRRLKEQLGTIKEDFRMAPILAKQEQERQLMEAQEREFTGILDASKEMSRRTASEQLMGAQNYFAQMMGRMGLSGSGMAGRGAMDVYGRVASGLADELFGLEADLRKYQMQERSRFRAGSWAFLDNVMMMGIKNVYDQKLLQFQAKLAQEQQSVWGDLFGALGSMAGYGIGAYFGGPAGAAAGSAVGGTGGELIGGGLDSNNYQLGR